MQVSQFFTRLLVPPEAAVSAEPTDRIGVLNARLARLKQLRQRRFVTRRLAMGVGVALFACFPMVLFLGTHIVQLVQGDPDVLPILRASMLLCGVILLAIAIAVPVWDVENEIRQTEDELDLLTDSNVSEERRAQKLFKIHQYQLNKYYDQTLRQSKWIFFVGVICLGMGFAAVGASLYLVHKDTSQQHYVVAALGAVGGLLSNFIGAIYLKMHAKTIKSLTEFHDRLVLTHYLHFGNFLLAKIKNDDLREKSLAQMALNLSTDQTHAHLAPPKKPARTKNGSKTTGTANGNTTPAPADQPA